MRVILGAGDDARLVVGGQPHRLRLVELGILKRRQAKQPVSETRMQPFLGDVDLIAENQLQRLRQFADDRRLLSVPRRRGRPRLVFSVVLWRQPHAEDAAASFGLLRRSLQPALGRSCARSRETPTGRPTEQGRHRERRCCPACAAPSAAAGRSGSRILLAASCPDSETAGRTNPGRCPDVPPSSR